jgi:hypothetical protein
MLERQCRTVPQPDLPVKGVAGRERRFRSKATQRQVLRRHGTTGMIAATGR